MKTIKIELRDRKAYKLLQDMEDLKLIRVIQGKSSSKVSRLRKQVKTPMTEEKIEQQFNSLRNKWERSTS